MSALDLADRVDSGTSTDPKSTASSPASGQRVSDPDRCVSCGVCTSVCPVRGIAMQLVVPDGGGIPSYMPVFSDVCTNCGSCELICPTAAIGIIP